MRRIRSRLIAAFVLVALLPAIPLSLVVHDLLSRSFGPSRSDAVREALDAGLEASRETLRAEKDAFRGDVRREILARSSGGAAREDAGVFDGREEGIVVRRLDHPRLVDRARPIDDPEGPLLAWAARTDPSSPDALPSAERVAGYLALVVRLPEEGRVLFARRLPPELEARAASVSEAIGLMEGLRRERGAAIRSYVLPFVLAYLVLLAIAVALGAVFAGRIARPIEELAAATREVAEGNLDARIPETGQGETRDLQVAFNEMVRRLAVQRRELARLERKAAWRDLARTLAHEIKNPLTPIQLAVQEMRDRFRGGDDAYARLLREAGEIVDEEIESLRRLVREFSEFARLPEPKPRDVDLAEVLRETARLYGPEKMTVEAPEAGIPARVDPDEMRRVFVNLADNAFAACAAAGRPERIVFRAGAEGDAVTIEAIDEGCGVAPENLERLFEPDFTTKKGGMGLGLAIVEGIVTAHRGAIDVRSLVNRGTTFTIRLPVCAFSVPDTLFPGNRVSGTEEKEEIGYQVPDEDVR